MAFLRTESGRSPHDRALTELIGGLSTRSDDFARRWARRDVTFHRSGHRRLRHLVVGELEPPYEATELPSDPGLRLNVHAPEPDSREREAHDLLASWTGAADVHH